MAERKKMYLGHVNLYVRDSDVSREWYERVLGLHCYHHRPGVASFMSADLDQSHEVALMTLGKDAPLQAKGQVGLNHLAFMVESLDLLKDYYRRLQANNVKVEHISDHGISLGIYFRDPDGNGVEVSYELPRDEWPVQEQVFGLPPDQRGRFPGPWDADPARR